MEPQSADRARASRTSPVTNVKNDIYRRSSLVASGESKFPSTGSIAFKFELSMVLNDILESSRILPFFERG